LTQIKVTARKIADGQRLHNNKKTEEIVYILLITESQKLRLSGQEIWVLPQERYGKELLNLVGLLKKRLQLTKGQGFELR